MAQKQKKGGEKIKAMLAHTYTGQNVNGWLMSEKYDGHRAMWTGEGLVSRGGNRISAPEWFVLQLPAMELDGELYIKGGGHDQVNSVIKKRVPVDSEWSRVVYMVFDAPAVKGPFEARMEAAAMALKDNKIASPIPQYVCQGDHKEFLREVCSRGGEGIVLRKAGSSYTEARSWNMLKYKPGAAEFFEWRKQGITCLAYQTI